MNNLSVSTKSASLGQSSPAFLHIDKLIGGITKTTQSANPVEWPHQLARLSTIFLAASLTTMVVFQNWYPCKLEAFNIQDKATQHKTDGPIIPPPKHS